MKPLYERALEEPLSEDMPWEVLDEFRQELFSQLEMFTDFPPDEDDQDDAEHFLADNIQVVADRLKIMAVLLPKAIRKAVAEKKVRRGGRTPVCALCHQRVERREFGG
jgi:hypothetical protein